MSTSTKKNKLADAEYAGAVTPEEITALRERVGRVLELVRLSATANTPIAGESLSSMGEVLSLIDDGLADIQKDIIPLGGELDDLDEAIQNLAAEGVYLTVDGISAIPTPDALFQSRGIVIQYHHHDKAWYAMRERRKVDDSYAPVLVLYEDGWDEWGKGRKGRMFETEIEARTAAAATACQGETVAGAAWPQRTAMIVFADSPSDRDGVSIVAHFDHVHNLPFDLAKPEGAHALAIESLSLLGRRLVSIDQPSIIGELEQAIANAPTGDDDRNAEACSCPRTPRDDRFIGDMARLGKGAPVRCANCGGICEPNPVDPRPDLAAASDGGGQ